MLSHTIYIVSSFDVTIVSCRRQATFHIGVSRYFTRAMPEFHVAVGNISLRKSLLLRLVGSSGLEPPTSCLSGTRSNLLSYEPMSFFYEAFSFHRRSCRLGGDEGNRTLDPLLAGQVLSQLSYTPIFPGSLKSLKIEQQLFVKSVSLYSRLYEDISISSRSP